MDKRKIANQKVKTSITSALFELLKEKSISEISITEIINKAHVARASFYRNYSSKESVITTLIQDILVDYHEEIKFEDGNFYTYENIYKSFKCFKNMEVRSWTFTALAMVQFFWTCLISSMNISQEICILNRLKDMNYISISEPYIIQP